MKGTRPRSQDSKRDLDLAYELWQSEKDRAENLMIVDMVRNDLGRICEPGTIKVSSLFSVEPYPSVWQMTSTVHGTLRDQATLVDIFAATFPGASITGAPKYRTMQIIRDLEQEPRGLYTGTIGLLKPARPDEAADVSNQPQMVCNICIRTIVHHQGHCLLGIGGGIVWDSNPEDEYREALSKAAFALRPHKQEQRLPCPGLFETMLLAEDGTYLFLEEHLHRLETSAKELGFSFSQEKAYNLLTNVSKKPPLVVRIDLGPNGSLSLSTRSAENIGNRATESLLGSSSTGRPPSPQAPPAVESRAVISPFRTDHTNPLLRYKTTQRDLYDRERQRAAKQGYSEVVFANVRGHITEGAITNIFFRFGSQWVTPPVEDGLLPGIWRQWFMKQVKAVEKSTTIAEALQADEVIVGNSVRGGWKVKLENCFPQ